MPLGRPNTIKLINESAVREIFLRQRPLTCAEVAAETGISVTTVRSIMREMEGRGELTSLGLTDSNGGRPSERFRIDDDCYEGLSVCLTDDAAAISVVTIQAEVRSTDLIPIGQSDDLPRLLAAHLGPRINEKTRSIGIGVPGIVTPQGYLRTADAQVIDQIDLLSPLRELTARPVVIENDLGASALGFSREAGLTGPRPGPAGSQALSRLTLGEVPPQPAGAMVGGTPPAASTVAFVNCESSCAGISAGFVEGGRIIHGMGNYAGELGLMPYARRTLREALYGAEDADERHDVLATAVAWVCCVINPHQVMLCGDSGFPIDRASVLSGLARRLPASMLPELTVGCRFQQYFAQGMALLTADAIFWPNDAAPLARPAH